MFDCVQFSSVQFSHLVASDSLRPHELQHTRPPCPSPSPGVHSNSRPSSRWCHTAISSSVVPFSSCPQSLPASESFPMSQFLAWGGQSTGVSAIALSVLLHWRRKYQPTQVFLPGESHGRRNLVGYSPRDTKSQTWHNKDTEIP